MPTHDAPRAAARKKKAAVASGPFRTRIPAAQAAAGSAESLAFTWRLIFRARGDRSSSEAFSRKTSRPPLASRVRSAALVTRRRYDWPSASDCRVAGDSAGRNRRFVLMFEWLTLWPTIGPTPV